jgi:membrane fusion protein, copper/silver efflux system
MRAKGILKFFGIVVVGSVLFAAGYFWAHIKMGNEKADMKGMGDMQGMAGMNMAPGTAMVSPAMQQLIGVRIATVESKTLGKTIRTVGTVAYDESRVTHVHSKVDGWVDKLFVNTTGALVSKGQPLFTIYSPDLVATQGEYLLAKKHHESLAASSIPEVKTGASALVTASKTRLGLWDISEEQLRDLEKKGEAQKTLTLYAPRAGFVIKKEINEGMKVMPDKELYTIADLSSVWVNVDVYESDIPYVRVGQQADITLSYSPGESFRGRVAYIYPYLDEKTRTMKVRLEHANPGYKLKPEMYVNAEIKIPGGAQLSIPEESVLDSGIRKIVFVDKGNGHFEAKEVKLGAKMDGYYQVQSGLKEDEKIAASAAFLLDSESRLSEAMGAMAGMPGMSMEGMAGMAGMEGTKGMEGMKDMKMKTPAKSGPMEKKVGDLTLTLSTQPEKTKAGENILRLKIVDKGGKPVNDAQVSFQYTMAMAGMVVSKAEAKLSKDGLYETKANFGMAGEWEVTVLVRRPGQKELQETFKVAAGPAA